LNSTFPVGVSLAPINLIKNTSTWKLPILYQKTVSLDLKETAKEFVQRNERRQALLASTINCGIQKTLWQPFQQVLIEIPGE